MLHRCRTQDYLYLSLATRHSFLIRSWAHHCIILMFWAANHLIMVFLNTHFIKVSSSMVKHSHLRHHRNLLQPAAKVCPV